jgi:hypothetical protein
MIDEHYSNCNGWKPATPKTIRAGGHGREVEAVLPKLQTDGGGTPSPGVVRANEPWIRCRDYENTSGKNIQVPLEKMAPVYNLFTATATNEEGGIEQAVESVQGFSHEGLAEDGAWSFIPPVAVSMPIEDREPTVFSSCNGDWHTPMSSCRGSGPMRVDGLVAAHFVEPRSAKNEIDVSGRGFMNGATRSKRRAGLLVREEAQKGYNFPALGRLERPCAGS